MSRSYQHSFLQRTASTKQQSTNSITEVETIGTHPGHRESIEGSTTDIIFPRAIDNIRPGRPARDIPPPPPPSISHQPRKPTRDVETFDQGKSTGYRTVDDDEWNKISRVEPKRRKQTKVRPKLLSDMFRKNPTALDNNGKLNLVSCYITEIDLLPEKISNRVKTLYLSHNSLENLLGLQQFQNLTCVSIANNSIRYLDTLLPLSSLTKLDKLTLEGNVVVSMPYYREIVLGMCCMEGQVGLSVLDGIRVTPEEKNASRVNYRKAAVQMEQMRCSGLRIAVLTHLQKLTRCHAEIVTQVVGRFR